MYTIFRIKLKAFNSSVLQDIHALQGLLSFRLWGSGLCEQLFFPVLKHKM